MDRKIFQLLQSPKKKKKFHRLSYTEAVLEESQRLCLVTPIIGPRRVLHDTNLLGYTISKETTVLVNLWSIHMNPDHYPDPESFKPERFFKNGVYVPDPTLVLFGEGIIISSITFITISYSMIRYKQ